MANGLRVTSTLYTLFHRIFRAIEWTLFRMLVIPEGYSQYILLFYMVAGVVREEQQLW
jgi:hypothetical protein